MPLKLHSFGTALFALAFGFAIMLTTGKAEAQMTTCMGMGPNMMTCNSMPAATIPNGGGGDIVDIIHHYKTLAVRKKVGQMIANGDCQGAARYAYSQGRLEIGDSVAKSCPASAPSYAPPGRASAYGQSPVSPAQGPTGLYETVGYLARNVPVPFTVDAAAGTVAVTKLEAFNTQLRMNVQVSDPKETLADVAAPANLQVICADSNFSQVLRLGGSMRLTFVRKNGALLGVATETGQLCGY
jgi:hypothetical protein